MIKITVLLVSCLLLLPMLANAQGVRRVAFPPAHINLPPSPAAALPLPLNSSAHGSAPNTLSITASLALVQGERDKYWLNARKIVRKSVLELVAQDQDELERGLRVSKIIRGDPEKRQIALTFDDGPHPDYTFRLLAILKQYHVPATFFVVGEQAERFPGLVQAEIAAGHTVGNHTYDHVSLVKIPSEYVATEIKACGEVLRQTTRLSPHLFRPPGGEYDDTVAETSEALGYTMVLWTDDPADYESPGVQVILTRTLAQASPGGIILLHDGITQTIDILPQIIQTLRARGYQFVSVQELLANRSREPRPVPLLTERFGL